MSEFKVIIGGHSQLPDDLPDFDKTSVTKCELRGAKLTDFWSHSTFRCMRENTHNLAILFLGGNDVYDNCEPKSIVSAICVITDHLLTLNDNVVITLLEPRNYPPSNRFGVSAKTYELVSKSVNKNLCKILKRKGVRTINLGARPFQYGHSHDGVHFDSLTKLHVTQKIAKCVEHHLNQ